MTIAESDSRKMVIIIGDYLGIMSGTARVISDMSWQFNENAIILTSVSRAGFAYSVSEKSEIMQMQRTHLSEGLPRQLRSWVPSMREGRRIARLIDSSENSFVLNAHTASSALLAGVIKSLSRRKRPRVSAFIYDAEELSGRLGLLLLQLLLRLHAIDEILVLDNKMAAFAREKLGTARVVVVRIGVSPSVIELVKKKDLIAPERYSEKKEFVVLFQGIPIPRRRLEDLVSAISMMEGKESEAVHLYIGGSLDIDHDYVRLLTRMVERLSLNSRVTFLGSLTEEELAFMYKRCDAFVFPCDNQTWGLAPLEALLFGKPAIVSTGAGVAEVLNDDLAILVPPRNPQALRDSISMLIKDEDLRERLGGRGRSYVLTNLTFTNTADELKALWGMKG